VSVPGAVIPPALAQDAYVNGIPAEVRRARHPYWEVLRSPRGLAGILLIVGLTVFAFIAGEFVDGPLKQSAGALMSPSLGHPFGTDELGRDILARLASGLRLDLLIILIAVPAAGAVGTLAGLVGMLNETISTAMQRVFDVLLGLPSVLLGVLVAIVLSPGRLAVVVAIVLATVPIFGRQARNGLLSQRPREYVTAAQVLGASNWRLLRRHILPNVMDSILVRGVTTTAEAIKIEGSLSVIGLGIQPPQASLGSMIKGGAPYLFDLPTYALSSVAVIVLIVMGCTLLSDALNATVVRR
jgi:peptide/nickel transport system permease protein